jgi:uncharacterized protein YndB with AHSA1/START domain
MNLPTNTSHDLTISRVIRAPRSAIWRAWTDPRSFEKWWIPAPLSCRVMQMDLQPGGAFVTEMSEDGAAFTPHVNACFLGVDPLERIIFTNALTGGWRPGKEHYPAPMTAIITLGDHPDGTDYAARVLHGDAADRNLHAEMGFYDGWGTVMAQLAALVERERV